MATGEAKLHNVQTMRDGRIVTSRDCRFVGPLAALLADRLDGLSLDRYFLPQSWTVNRSHGQ